MMEAHDHNVNVHRAQRTSTTGYCILIMLLLKSSLLSIIYCTRIK